MSMLVEHEKNDLCDVYIVEFIHDATENSYEEWIYVRESWIRGCPDGRTMTFG